MKIGILGTGDVARALAVGLVARGHTVKFGTRDPGSAKTRALLVKVPQASIGSFARPTCSSPATMRPRSRR